MKRYKIRYAFGFRTSLVLPFIMRETETIIKEKSEEEAIKSLKKDYNNKYRRFCYVKDIKKLLF